MKDRILNKAGEMFLNQGFKSVTMDDIAESLGVSKKTIYTHFSSKKDLVEGVAFDIYNNICCGIDHILVKKKEPIEEIYEIKKYMMTKLKGEKSSPVFQLHKFYPEIFNTIKQMQYEKMSECTVENLKRGVKAGVYRDNINVPFISRIYFLGMNGIKDESIFPLKDFPKDWLHEEYLSYHLRGIVTKKGLEKLNKIIENGN